jgi:tRNA modification GTPase
VTVVNPRTGQPLDEALCVVMRAPRSYTGEDTVELSCHGSPAVLGTVVELLTGLGARLAEPGEFTRRAFLNGRLALGQAEAVALLISARTERAVTLAARALAGGVSEPMTAMRETLLDLIASLEVALDFPDEQIGVDVQAARATVIGLRDQVAARLASARSGQVVHEGLTVALAGPPNAGKSSLFNALLGRERVIVSPVAGTTRDVVEATLVLAGTPVRLLDTAGIGEPRDDLDAEGIRRSRAAIDESDLVLVVLDGSLPPDRGLLDETKGRSRLIVLAKGDLQADADAAALEVDATVSVRIAGGTDELIRCLTAEVESRTGRECDEGGIVASLRQREALESLRSALERAALALEAAPLEIALVDLREALTAISDLLGIDVADGVLDRIFARFCVGK